MPRDGAYTQVDQKAHASTLARGVHPVKEQSPRKGVPIDPRNVGGAAHRLLCN